MATQFAPVELGSIEQGDFLNQCEAAFKKVQREFIAHVEQFERSSTGGLVMKVNLAYDAEKKAYAIITTIEAKLPKHPAGVTSAFVADDPQGGQCLFSQAAGTSDGEPKQMRLTDDKGQPIDYATGKSSIDNGKS